MKMQRTLWSFALTGALFLDMSSPWAQEVGIGTTTPTALLDVQAPASYTKDLFQILRGTDTFFIVKNNGNVGIGTAMPIARLHVANDGMIYAEGTYGSGDAIPSGAKTAFIWNPRTAAIRAGGVAGSQWHPVNVGPYSTAFGYNNTASGDYSTIGGGVDNTASGRSSTVGGGFDNTASGRSSTVGGGGHNTASGYYSTVGGGEHNTASGRSSTIGGGVDNITSGRSSTVGGGVDNTASGRSSTIGGGEHNIASGLYSTVGGGWYNTASWDYSTIGGGGDNTASGYYNTIGGGEHNTASGLYSTVGGGWYNTASWDYSTVGGGFDNTASGWYSTVGGGGHSTASGFSSTIGGGGVNTASGYYSTVGGGGYNTASGEASTVGGGRYDTASGYYSTVGGGVYNTASGYYSTIGGGGDNTASGYYSFAVGHHLYARSYGEMVLGVYNTDYTPNDPTAWHANDRLLVVGNGTGAANRSDALVILKNGNTGIGTSTPAARLHVAGTQVFSTNGGTVSGYVGLYQSGGELYAFDATGNATQISPHNARGEWHFNSRNTHTGRHLVIDVERLLFALDRTLGGGYIHINGETVHMGANEIETIKAENAQQAQEIETIKAENIQLKDRLTYLENELLNLKMKRLLSALEPNHCAQRK